VEGRAPLDARVVDKDVDGADLLLYPVDGGIGLGLVRHVEGVPEGLVPPGLEIRDAPAEFFLAAAVQDDGRPRGGESFRQDQAETLARSGNKGPAAVKSEKIYAHVAAPRSFQKTYVILSAASIGGKKTAPENPARRNRIAGPSN